MNYIDAFQAFVYTIHMHLETRVLLQYEIIISGIKLIFKLAIVLNVINNMQCN